MPMRILLNPNGNQIVQSVVILFILNGKNDCAHEFCFFAFSL
jgi:hypothetical protein